MAAFLLRCLILGVDQLAIIKSAGFDIFRSGFKNYRQRSHIIALESDMTYRLKTLGKCDFSQ